MPFHLRADKTAMLRRQCTNEYKLRPIRGFIRKQFVDRKLLLAVRLWIGISCDEAHRMRDSSVLYIQNEYPLIDRRMRRSDCLNWLKAHGYPQPPKSSCIGCPFHDDHYWHRLRENSPAEFAEAVEFDKSCRTLPRIKGEVFLHRSLRPLDVAIQGGQIEMSDMFGEECEGMCGV